MRSSNRTLLLDRQSNKSFLVKAAGLRVARYFRRVTSGALLQALASVLEPGTDTLHRALTLGAFARGAFARSAFTRGAIMRSLLGRDTLLDTRGASSRIAT